MEGHMEWMFFGFEKDPNTLEIDPWMVLDMNNFRWHMSEERHWTRRTKEERDNGDGTAFYSFDARRYMDEYPIIVATSNSLEINAS
jgi:hypothetical protein